MAENRYKAHIKSRLEEEFPGCMVLVLDSGHMQGVPDRLVLYGDRWASLEIKDHIDSPKRPNQPYYVELMNDMSFSAFLYPENEQEVFDELHRVFSDPARYARLLES